MLTALIISIAILFAGPLFGAQLNRHAGAWQAMDGFVVMVVLGILTLNILPPVLESKTMMAPALFLVGLALPSLAEQLTQSHNTHKLVLGIPAVALIAHALGDGSLLRLLAAQEETLGTTLGVLLHRIGLATAIWWLVVTNHGTKGGWLFVLLMSTATLLGYFGTATVLSFTGETTSPLTQAFAAGSLLHILVHPLDTEAINKGRGRGMHRAGSLIGLIVVCGILGLHFLGHPTTIEAAIGIHDHSQSDALDRLLHLGVGLSPFLLALAVAGFWVPRIKVLALVSVIIWLFTFAILPHNILPHNGTGIALLTLYGFVMVLHFIRFGARTMVAALVPQSSHTHKH